VWLEGLGQLKNSITSSGIEPATFWLDIKVLQTMIEILNIFHCFQ
jgi:hypothetical protein